MLLNVNISPAQAPPGAGFNISVQVEAADLGAALEAAKAPVLAAAKASAAALNSALPGSASTPAEPQP